MPASFRLDFSSCEDNAGSFSLVSAIPIVNEIGSADPHYLVAHWKDGARTSPYFYML
jgi:hypothetical protein